MKLARTALFGAVSLALAAGSAFAADTKKSRFDRLDANNDGVITRAEAAGSATVLTNFDRADKNNDGKITRAEYRAAFANKDAKRKPANTAANERDPGFNALDRNNDGYVTRAEALGNPHLAKNFKAADRNNDGKLNRAEYLAAMTKKDLGIDRDARASTGATAASKDRDPGFNALDRNNDGYITRAEARGNPHLAKNFKAADRNNDGKLNRAEYLAVMAKKDANTAKAKVGNAIDREPRASTGATAPPQ
jgi:Ca2+-binding EF-hand superfamily protein